MSDSLPDTTMQGFKWMARPVDWDRARAYYDGVSDELLVDFDGTGRPAVSIAIDTADRDYVYARVDPDTGETVGLQFDAFLAYAVPRQPALLVLLDFAELRGITADQIVALRRRYAAGPAQRAAAGAIVEGLVPIGA